MQLLTNHKHQTMLLQEVVDLMKFTLQSLPQKERFQEMQEQYQRNILTYQRQKTQYSLQDQHLIGASIFTQIQQIFLDYLVLQLVLQNLDLVLVLLHSLMVNGIRMLKELYLILVERKIQYQKVVKIMVVLESSLQLGHLILVQVI